MRRVAILALTVAGNLAFSTPVDAQRGQVVLPDGEGTTIQLAGFEQNVVVQAVD